MNGYIIILIVSAIIGLVISLIIKKNVHEKTIDKSILDEKIKIENEIKDMKNKYYMLNLDVEKSRQKLSKSISFLEGLKNKTSNVDLDKMKAEMDSYNQSKNTKA